MAITLASTIRTGAAILPTSYTPPVLGALSVVDNAVYSTDIATTEGHASVPATGIANVLAAVEADFTATQRAKLRLDAAGTFNVNLTINKVELVNNNGTANGNTFLLPAFVYKCTVVAEWD